jgi:hypothetical protein
MMSQRGDSGRNVRKKRRNAAGTSYPNQSFGISSGKEYLLGGQEAVSIGAHWWRKNKPK